MLDGSLTPDISTALDALRAGVAQNRVDEDLCHQVLSATSRLRDSQEAGIHAEVLNYLASLRADQNQFGTGIDYLTKAVLCAPNNITFRVNLAVLLRRFGWLENAVRESERAIRIAPDHARAHLVLGVCAYQYNKPEIAERAFRRVIELEPDNMDGLLNLASLMIDIDSLPEAERVLARVLATYPDEVRALMALGALRARAVRLGEAMEAYDRARAIDPLNPEVRWNRALVLMMRGDLPTGWQGMEARFLSEGAESVPGKRFTQPMWNKTAPKGSRVLIQSEQGMGDVMQFGRYAPMVAELGYDVRFEVDNSLVELFRESFPTISIVPRALDWPLAAGLPDFDYQVAVMSLPGILGTTLETVPWSGPYLKANERKVRQWAAKVAPLTGFKVGLCWAGLKRAEIKCAHLDARRSVAFRLLEEALFSVEGCSFVSLQLGPNRNDHIGGYLPIEDFGDELESWADTAALAANLDLVITVDSAVAHLAAGMGKRVWLLSRWDQCWRWLQDRTDTPWYPSLTIYQQKADKDWSAPLTVIAKDLAHAASG